MSHLAYSGSVGKVCKPAWKALASSGRHANGDWESVNQTLTSAVKDPSLATTFKRLLSEVRVSFSLFPFSRGVYSKIRVL